MTKCAKKYRKGAVRLMTMEMVEQDDNAVDSLTERSAGHLQNQPGQNQISSGSEVSVAASSAGRGSPAVTLVQLPSGQTVHVQGVIQATQPSVIQSPHMQAVQVASIADEAAQSEVIIDSQKRREILSRRPSYRKILNELSSDAPAVAKIEEEEKSEDEGTPSVTISQGGTIQTVTNSGAPQPGATIVQYAAQSSDGTQQFFVPGSQVVVQAATGDMPAYQIRTPTTTLPQGVVMAASPGTLHSPQQMAEEATRKRELRLLKNREAARECRRKKKEYVKCLENRVAVLENQNKTLIEELKALKDLYCHKAE
ncbi:cAMP-responsive element modulator isoform X4 [Ammospiza caudacuta]|uniref:cAMP-responsive element modulator isoform X4 n=2 Tax=Passeroidea TaxID=175121 RepID=UPI0008DB8383|nr:cAMP-responsive element modulator isoform X3 [Zonotrichia albicollis]XP_050826395.1 cAMP-responsive element modulator isoform X4 [Serinus canaria]XP_058663166.1 cAMP-responsive element modulator isoform X4 [Ammospiza caudacuta]XP_059696158.1 cAMP-responsive element modulator isoform X4 [Haemorhous mexicanus]